MARVLGMDHLGRLHCDACGGKVHRSVTQAKGEANRGYAQHSQQAQGQAQLPPRRLRADDPDEAASRCEALQMRHGKPLIRLVLVPFPTGWAGKGFSFAVGLARFLAFYLFFGVALGARPAYVRAAKSALPEP